MDPPMVAYNRYRMSAVKRALESKRLVRDTRRLDPVTPERVEARSAMEGKPK
jgi:hypothetical protein